MLYLPISCATMPAVQQSVPKLISCLPLRRRPTSDWTNTLEEISSYQKKARQSSFELSGVSKTKTKAYNVTNETQHATRVKRGKTSANESRMVLVLHLTG